MTTTIAVPMNSATSSCRCQRRMSTRAIILIASSTTRDAADARAADQQRDDQRAQVAQRGGPSMPITADT